MEGNTQQSVSEFPIALPSNTLSRTENRSNDILVMNPGEFSALRNNDLRGNPPSSSKVAVNFI